MAVMILVMLAGYMVSCMFFSYSTTPVSASISTAVWEASSSSPSARAGSAAVRIIRQQSTAKTSLLECTIRQNAP